MILVVLITWMFLQGLARHPDSVYNDPRYH